MISQTSEYALRATIFLAARTDDTPASANEISEAIRVPAGFLQKILRMLARRGILTVRRGANGGFTLAKVPSAISVLEVLQATETMIPRIKRCPLGIKGHMSLCSLHRLLDNEMARAERTFATTTLEDLLDGSGGVRPFCDESGRLPTSISIERGESSPPASK